MKQKQQKPDTAHVLNGLKDFQRTTVDYVYHRLYEDEPCADRFLIADEVGLGKTLVARGIIARAVDKLWQKDGHRIDIVYICANQDIARQNINRLNITGEPIANATRMTLLPLYLHDIRDRKLNFVSFTPGTSFDLRSRGGIAYERVLIYHLLREAWDFGDVAGPKNLLQVGVERRAWHKQLRQFRQDQRDKKKKVDESLKQAFFDTLGQTPKVRKRFEKLAVRFGHHRKRQNVDSEDRRDQLALIGTLRRLLAKSCVGALEPDIVILDEFQRFKNLLDDDDEMALLAQELFNYEGAKTLLLSATPYKMYTMYHERSVEDHYTDFIRTTRFLFNSDKQTEDFEADLRHYVRPYFNLMGMLQPNSSSPKPILNVDYGR